MACTFVGVTGGGVVGLGAPADGLEEANESPVEATTAPIVPTTSSTAPTTITSSGHRRRFGGAPDGARPSGSVVAAGAAGRLCDPSGGGGNASIG
ncbi:MAG TPA: hypothetical protein VJ736_06025, partial [Actinomycetota bacterium]|nr:hypothetical protein [Actinomycetota bacterium]